MKNVLIGRIENRDERIELFVQTDDLRFMKERKKQKIILSQIFLISLYFLLNFQKFKIKEW